MNNQIFDCSRFTAALRKEVVENKRLLLLGALGIYAALALTMTFGNLFFGVDKEDSLVPFMTVFIFFSIGLIVSASLTFRQLRTKVGRIEYFTSPSSTLEKFLVNVIVYVIGFVVVFIACVQLADLTRWGLMSIFSAEVVDYAVPGPINYLATIHNIAVLGRGIDNVTWLEASMWIGIAASAGLYAMGSALWPKLSFLKTFGAVYAIETVFSIGTIFFADMEVITSWMDRAAEAGTLFIWLAALAAIQVLIYWAIAWLLLKHKDVVSLKWWK